jgi:tetratricopeptide (TPR) repeat protein
VKGTAAQPVRPSLSRRLGAALVAAAGLAVLAGAVYLIGRQVWAYHHFREAKTALEGREFDPARAHFALCLEVWPTSAETHFLAARAARRAGVYDEADQHLKRSRELGWVPGALDAEQAMLEAQRGEPEKVQSLLWTWIREDHAESLLMLEALTHGYMKAYNLPAAMLTLQEWLRRDPDAVQALYWRGEACERLHRYEEALADFRRAQELDPKRDDIRLRMASALVHAHRSAEATPHFEILYDHQPDNAAVLLGLARCRMEQGRPEEARALLDALLAAHPGDGLALGERGLVELEAGNAEEAERWLRQAVAVVPYERDIVYSFVQVLERRGKKEEADAWTARLNGIEQDLTRIAEVMRVIIEDPRNPAPRHEAGTILMRNGQEQEGLRWLSNALSLDPHYRPTRLLLAEYCGKHDKPDEAAIHRRLAAPE